MRVCNERKCLPPLPKKYQRKAQNLIHRKIESWCNKTNIEHGNVISYKIRVDLRNKVKEIVSEIFNA